MSFNAHIQDAKGRRLVTGEIVAGSGAAPDYTATEALADDELGVFLLAASNAWRVGLYGKPAIGEVRDMLYAMEQGRRALGEHCELVIPDETRAEAEAESRAHEAEMERRGILFY